MNLLRPAPLLSFLALFAIGCADDPYEDLEAADGDEGSSQAALLATNGLAPNGLAPNGLAPNGLAPNGLAPNGLAPNGLSSSALAAISEDSAIGEQNRQLLEYVVSCALTPAQSFAFNWTDSSNVVHNEVYFGVLGLASNWANSPLTNEIDQRMMSACLAARTNWYGMTVQLSLRSKLDPLRTMPQSAELTAYPHVEGAFWGNLFAASPYIHACYDDNNVDLARANHRDCATGHLTSGGQTVECGIINVLGPCSEWCNNLDPHERWYNNCEDPNANGLLSEAAIAVALP